MTAMSFLFLIGCLVSALSALAVMLWSPAPCGHWCRVRALARWAIFAGSMFLSSRVLSGGVATWDGVLLVWGVGAAYVLQARSEAIRQRNVPAVGERRRA